MSVVIISPYDDLLPQEMGIVPEKIEDFKYRYNLGDCTIENFNRDTRLGEVPNIVVMKSGRRNATIRTSRITALIQ